MLKLLICLLPLMCLVALLLPMQVPKPRLLPNLQIPVKENSSRPMRHWQLRDSIMRSFGQNLSAGRCTRTLKAGQRCGRNTRLKRGLSNRLLPRHFAVRLRPATLQRSITSGFASARVAA